MSIGVDGNYIMNLSFGDNHMPLDVGNIHHFFITQDIDMYTPTCEMGIVDGSEFLTQITLPDASFDTINLSTSHSIDSPYSNDYSFSVLSKTPEDGTYNVQALLNVPNLIDTTYKRGWNKSIKEVLVDIVTEELGIDEYEISDSLDYAKLIVQPNWTNAQLFTYLKNTLVGMNGDAGWYCYIKVYHGKYIFVFKHVNEFNTADIKFRYIVGSQSLPDAIGAYAYRTWDNYGLFRLFGSRQQNYSYFDYDSGQYVDSSVDTSGYASLTQYFGIETNDTEGGINPPTGRSTDYSSDSMGMVKSSFYKRVSGLSKMMLTAQGNMHICPGDKINVTFANSISSGMMNNYQYAGDWIVEKVIHMYSTTYMNKLLLTRNGIDTTLDTTLLKYDR